MVSRSRGLWFKGNLLNEKEKKKKTVKTTKRIVIYIRSKSMLKMDCSLPYLCKKRFFNSKFNTHIVQVMVNFICQLDWAKRCPERAGKTLFWVWLSGYLWKISAFELIDWTKKRLPSPIQVGISQFAEGLNRTKRWKKGRFTLYLSWNIHLLLPSNISAAASRTF